MSDYADTLTETGFNNLVEKITRGVSYADLALQLDAAEEKIRELTELAHDQEEHIVTLEAVCILHGWNPISGDSDVDEA